MLNLSRRGRIAICYWLAFVGFITCTTMSSRAAADPHNFEIAAGSAVDTLREFGRQAKMQMLFNYRLVRELRTQAVVGVLEPDEALARMLSGTGLTFQRVNERTVAIGPETDANPDVTQRALSNQTRMRVAQAESAQAAEDASSGTTAPASGVDAESQNESTERNADALQEVVVTAQFRQENLQETPIAITALSAESLEARSFSKLTDLTDSAPNVVMKPAGSNYGPGVQLFIRGVGQGDTSFALEPGVGIYVDDVYRGVVFGGVLDLLDLDRVEILRGPQGTLAGKNSIGGAVKLFTKKPTGDGEGYLEVTGGSFDRMDIKGSADFSLVQDRLFARVSGVNRQRDGYFTRYDFACMHPGSNVPTSVANANNCKLGTEGGQDYTAGRLALRWVASEAIEVNLVGNRLDDNSETPPNKLLALSLVPSAAATLRGANQAQFLTEPESYSNYSTYTVLPFTDPARYNGQPGAGTHAAVTMSANIHLRTEDYAGTVDWQLSDSLALKSITAYQDIQGIFTNDADATPYTVVQSDFDYAHRQLTQELRLNGEALDKVVDWTLGAYYYDGTSRNNGVNYLQPGTAGQNLNSPNDRILSRSKSGFAHGVWHVTPALDFTAGLRYTDDARIYRYQRLNPFVAGIPTYTPAGVLTGVEGRYEGDRWDYRANVSYQWTDDLMTYVQYSTGYRGGGVNPRPFVPEQAVPFNPETLGAYEIGVKSDFFAKRLRVNLSTFFNQYKDIIFTNTAATPTSLQNATPTNAGDADIKGAELELAVRPVMGLLVDASVSYLDFQLQSIGAAGATITGITLDNVAPFNPEWKASMGIQYELPLGNAGSISPRVDGAYQSSFYSNIDNHPLGKVDGYSVFNARLLWRSSKEDWEAGLAVTNLTDKFYYLNKFRQTVGFASGQPAPPRQWAVSIKRNF